MKNYHLVKKINTTNIHLYNSNGTIKKYNNISEIIEEFYLNRLQSYIDRKKYIENKMELELELISLKVKFILGVIEKNIKINNKSKDQIEKKLEEKEFPKMLNGIKNENGNYNYLLGMNLWSLTYEKVEELKKQQENKELELEILKNKKPEDIWKEELEELLKKYEEWYSDKKKEDMDSFCPENITKKKTQIKKKTNKKKLSIKKNQKIVNV